MRFLDTKFAHNSISSEDIQADFKIVPIAPAYTDPSEEFKTNLFSLSKKKKASKKQLLNRKRKKTSKTQRQRPKFKTPTMMENALN
jgi:hypothetical protein